MPKMQKKPGEALQSYIDDYRINAFSLSKSLNVAYQSVTNIINGKARISVQMALRLGQFFGNSPEYWLDIQIASEIDELGKNKKFVKEIKSIPKAKKPSGKAEKKVTAKAGKKKTNTLAEKRKKASKVPGARGRKPKKT
ncbi:MAG: HigA family addiction module antitoxin [Treponema sp.]|nr:HigA family addiction module antitoxin [Treponema sp.]